MFVDLPGQSRRDAIFAYLMGRAIKLTANSLRPLFYCHFWLFPHQRFKLATHHIGGSKAISTAKRSDHDPELIPRIVWQTNYTNKVTLPLHAAWRWNRCLSANYDYCFHNTEERLVFVEENFPGAIAKAYQRLTIGAAQADLWRLLVLYKYGGVYLDIDAHLVWPLKRITNRLPEIFIRYKNKEATNYFIASKAQNPTIKALIDEVLLRIEHSDSNNVYEITGPSVLEDILKKRDHCWRFSSHTCLQGNFSNKFFQYLDKPAGCWTTQQKSQRVVST